MGDVGIDLLKPRYNRAQIVPEDTAYWEVLYDDGSVLSEAQGATYGQIDRLRLKSFRVVHNGTIVFELFPEAVAKSGQHLIYRRRSSLTSQGGRGVVFILGLGPDGPIFCLDIARNTYYEDTAGLFPTLTPMPGEPPGLVKTMTLSAPA